MNDFDYSPNSANAPASPEEPTAVIGFEKDQCHGEHCVPEANALFPIISFLAAVVISRYLYRKARRRAQRVRRPLLW